jgi:hypothetical protein
MASKSKRARLIKQRNLSKDFMYWAIAVFIIKLIIISNVQGGAWLGADGENYLKGYDAMVKDGIFSKESFLSYWPAGYPLFILFLSLIGKSFVLTTLAVLQSAIFSFCVYFFAAQLAETRLRKFSYIAFFMMILNPTLSLSSIAVGYESLTASGFILILALTILNFNKTENQDKKIILLIATTVGFMSFLQPRLLISGLLICMFLAFRKYHLRLGAVMALLSIIVALVMPSTLIYRNNQAINLNTISTNGSAAFNMGAGIGATGGYVTKAVGVPCVTKSTDPTKIENEKIVCILKWYLGNPKESMRLFFNKTIYFWSPWFGPVANGTMARNPWLEINPLKEISSSPDGAKLVFGSFGKVISWAWLLTGLVLLFAGARKLIFNGGTERAIGIVALIIILINWAVALITIGDHRFRVPIMGASLFLQAVGLQYLVLRRKTD